MIPNTNPPTTTLTMDWTILSGTNVSDNTQAALLSIRGLQVGILILGGIAFWEIGEIL